MKAYLFELIVISLIAVAGIPAAYIIGHERGTAETLAKAPPAMSMNVDNMCAAWLFETSLQEAKQKICGTRKPSQKAVGLLVTGDQTIERKAP